MNLPPPNQRTGPLEGHVRKGRVYRSPIAATGVLQLGDWVRDDLPDLLWPVLVLSELGTMEVKRFLRWQQAVQDDLVDSADPGFVSGCLDGRLTNLDRLVAQIPDARAIVKKRAQDWGLLPDLVARAMASFPFRPAGWLIDLEVAVPGRAEIDLLARALHDSLRDGHREAVIKCLPIWSAVHAGTLRTTAETIELLQPYPNDATTRSMADTVIRAMWGANKGVQLSEDADAFADAIRWAKVFWGANSMTTRCVRRGDSKPDNSYPEDGSVDAADDVSGGDAESAGEMPEDGSHLRGLALDLLSSYVEALETSPSRLYDQERQEVHAGLVSRAGRDVITALGAPDLWCMEHGAHIVRVLVEVRIYIQWMSNQDAAIYSAFQAYGAGKAKLYARIMNEIPEAARQPEFEDALKELSKLSHNDDIFDHRVVDTRDSFADGKSIRTMAEECGLIDLYRQAYYMASGVAHSEWWSVETHAMERCLNVLHRGHLIPSLSLNGGGNVPFARSWVDQLYALMRISLQILGTDKRSVADAFAWVEEDPSDQPSDGADPSTSS